MADYHVSVDEKPLYPRPSPSSTNFSNGDTIVSIPDEPDEPVKPIEPVEPTEPNLNNGVSKKRFWHWLWRCLRYRKAIPISDIKEVITRTLEDCPKGYPKLAAFLSSEHNFSLYRGFSYLHSRVLLDLQDEISTLEKELDTADIFDSANGHENRLSSRRRDQVDAQNTAAERSRRHILSDVRAKLVDYDEILCKARELAAFQKPSDRDYGSVRTWFYNVAPVVQAEERWIKRKEDIVTLHHGREWSSFDGLVESLLRKIDCRLIKFIFCTPELRDKTSDENIHYYSTSRVGKFVGLLITIVIFILLVLPVVAMYRLTSFGRVASTFDAVGVLIVFTLLFSAAMSLLTKARRHELFAASAAYCAVLVVFISNFSNTGG
ncbi:uncharacterized protein K441DRAFT_142941 [Cenococcum geophilum 1.58]|uniref:uncharacterized protein n=1 Tax=Cenococcum geophilum 1.58 TaxID=794803 RepID=UPI00358E3302|nr:hypothetical protein K441DRAFT_142941 [Cenococcum geophilum 1.58]